ncbi:MAG: GntR family transcriptional regulator [Candidatus Promineifilaceae bacterium]|nr:GntR family transcriptional regulator [Candidatus Promineifilaceae bacterium]
MDKLERYLANQPTHLTEDTSRLRREIAYMRIKDAIQHADLEPGEPLSETRLSRSLGISRTPIREALRRLAQEGLVEVIPGRAVTVASHSMQGVMDVVHIRYILEPELTRLAVDAISADDLARLTEAMEKMEAAVDSGDQLAWSKADTDFHEILSAACPNKLLGELIVQMRNRVHYLANVDSQTNPARLAACTREHREIVDAFIDRDAERASQVTRAHIEKLRQSLFTRLSYG